MKIIVARIISIVTHPFAMMSLLVFLPLSHRDTGGAVRATLSFAGIVLVPISVLIWRCYISGEWQTVDASDKADRPVLFSISIMSVVAAAAYFHFIDHSPDIVRGCIISAVMLLIAAGLNRWIKISLHLTFACFCGVCLARVQLIYGLPVLLMLPPLIWSRLVLSRHTVSETMAGVVLGLSGAALLLWQ